MKMKSIGKQKKMNIYDKRMLSAYRKRKRLLSLFEFQNYES